MLQTLSQLPPTHLVFLAAVVTLFSAYPLVLVYAYWTAHSAPAPSRTPRAENPSVQPEPFAIAAE